MVLTHGRALVLAFILAACGSRSVTQAGTAVALVHQEPQGDCTSLGPLTGHGGGVGGGWVANDTLIEYAHNDLRNEAAALGATHVLASSPVMGETDGTTTTATVTGTAFRCTSVEGNDPEAFAREALARIAPAAVAECAVNGVLGARIAFEASGRVHELVAVTPEEARPCLAHGLVQLRSAVSAPVTVDFDFVAVLRPPTAGGEQPPAAPPPASAPPPTTQPAISSEDDQRIRALVDERRDDILACVAAERAAVRVTVTADGALEVALHGDLAGTPQENCVRSLFADVTLDGVAEQAEVIHIVRAAGEAEQAATDESAP